MQKNWSQKDLNTWEQNYRSRSDTIVAAEGTEALFTKNKAETADICNYQFTLNFDLEFPHCAPADRVGCQSRLPSNNSLIASALRSKERRREFILQGHHQFANGLLLL